MPPRGAEANSPARGEGRIPCSRECARRWCRCRNSALLLFGTWVGTGCQTHTWLTHRESGAQSLQSPRGRGWRQRPLRSLTFSALWPHGFTCAWLGGFTSNISNGNLFIILCRKTRLQTRIRAWWQVRKNKAVDCGAVLASSGYPLRGCGRGRLHCHAGTFKAP